MGFVVRPDTKLHGGSDLADSRCCNSPNIALGLLGYIVFVVNQEGSGEDLLVVVLLEVVFSISN